MSPRHIAYLTGEYPRATDTWIQREIAALRHQGIEVSTFSVRRPGPEHLVGPEQKQGLATTTYLLEQARSGRIIGAHFRALTRSPRRYLRALRLALATKRPGIRGGVFQLFYLAEAVVLADEIRARGADHLHNHFGDSSCTVAMLAAEVGGFPFSFTLHGSAIFFQPYTWRLDEKIRRSTFCACISHFSLSQAAIFAPEHVDKLHIVHCGIEPQRLSPITHAGRGNRLLFVGRIAAGKGLDLLLDTMTELRADIGDIELTIVGDGPERARLESRARDHGLDGCVHFVGSKSQDEVGRLLVQHDIFVLPSFAEGVPVVLMEALGSRLAVVSTLVGGVTELVEDGVTGLLVRPYDRLQLRESLRRLIDDHALRQRLGEAGREKVLDQFVSADEARRLGHLFDSYQRGREVETRPARPESPSSSTVEPTTALGSPGDGGQEVAANVAKASNASE